LTTIVAVQLLMSTGCGRFFEGTPEEMDKALNQTLAALPDDTKVYVRSIGRCLLSVRPLTLAARPRVHERQRQVCCDS